VTLPDVPNFGAPSFDTATDRRRRIVIFFIVTVLGAVFGGFWLASGAPFDWPWTWSSHRAGTIAVDQFLRDVEKNDLREAYAVWNNDKDWQQHPARYAYTFDRFQRDWAPNGQENDYGVIRTHVLKMAHVYGNVLAVGVQINGRKDKALYLDFDRRAHTLNFSVDEYYMAP